MILSQIFNSLPKFRRQYLGYDIGLPSPQQLSTMIFMKNNLRSPVKSLSHMLLLGAMVI
jgi:hypothetical protein